MHAWLCICVLPVLAIAVYVVACLVFPTVFPNPLHQESLVSRDEMAAALVEISEGKIPRDRVALMELHREMTNWPFLEEAGRCWW